MCTLESLCSEKRPFRGMSKNDTFEHFLTSKSDLLFDLFFDLRPKLKSGIFSLWYYCLFFSDLAVSLRRPKRCSEMTSKRVHFCVSFLGTFWVLFGKDSPEPSLGHLQRQNELEEDEKSVTFLGRTHVFGSLFDHFLSTFFGQNSILG